MWGIISVSDSCCCYVFGASGGFENRASRSDYLATSVTAGDYVCLTIPPDLVTGPEGRALSIRAAKTSSKDA